MSLDWNDLKVFLALERGGSARSAAADLGASHSTVLRRLSALETALSARVFDRTPDGLALTAAGARLLIKAQQIEAEVTEAEREVSGADIRLQGPIRLTAPPPVLQYLLLPHLAEFQRNYPDIDLEIVSTYSYSNLDRRDADIAIRFAMSPDEHLVGRRLPIFYDAVYASKSYDERHRKTDQDMAWISWSDVDRFRHRIADTPYANAPIALRLPDLTLQAEAARLGQGMALLPCIVGDHDPQLVRVAGTRLHQTLPAWLLTHPDLRRLERVRIFARFLIKVMSEAVAPSTDLPDLK